MPAVTARTANSPPEGVHSLTAMSAHRSDMPKSRLEGYGTLLPSKCKEIYEHIEVESFDDRPQSGKAAVGVPDQVGPTASYLAHTL